MPKALIFFFTRNILFLLISEVTAQGQPQGFVVVTLVHLPCNAAAANLNVNCKLCGTESVPCVCNTSLPSSRVPFSLLGVISLLFSVLRAECLSLALHAP